MDRASGSGVFARDPDAMLDMLELQPEFEDDIPEGSTAWRVSSVLREFKPTKPFEVVFDYPLHKVVHLEGATEMYPDLEEKNEQRKAEKGTRIDKFIDYVYNYDQYKRNKEAKYPYVSECAAFVGVADRTIRDYIKQTDKVILVKGVVKPANET